MLNVITSGLPISAKDILSEAVELAFGKDVVGFIELNKDNLRSRVRLSKRDVQVILVVLDGVASDICKDIEGGLYSSDKYLTYTDDTSLVEFLNSKYSLKLEVPVELPQNVSESEEGSEANVEMIERYEAQLRDRGMMIESLEGRIQEITDLLENEDFLDVSQEDFDNLKLELDSVKQENLSLRDKILSSEHLLSEKTELVEAVKKEREELKNVVEKLEKSKNSLLADYRSVNAELTELKVENSKQLAVINSKTAEIQSLQGKVEVTVNLEKSLEDLKSELNSKEKIISDLSAESANLSVDLSSRDKEIERLREEVKQNGITSDMVESLKAELNDMTVERDSLLKDISIRDISEESVQSELSALREKVSSYEEEIVELQDKVKEYDNNISVLNTEKLRLQGQVRVLEQSTDRNSDVEGMSAELVELRSKYNTLSNGVFGRICSLAMPKGSSAVYLTRRGVKLNNVRFVFAGSTESRKGAYRCLLNEFKASSNGDRFLIVDVVSETSIDYVFEIQSIVNGLEWFRRGGGVQAYLSKTCLRNVNVLSSGLGYINDSYFLTVDWENRLSELENSGYKVVLFCGDISNIIGRVMHESFADLGVSDIYVHGNAIGSRTIVTNLKGISNAKASKVMYFDFNENMKRFYDMVSKNNKCVVLSKINRGR